MKLPTDLVNVEAVEGCRNYLGLPIPPGRRCKVTKAEAKKLIADGKAKQWLGPDGKRGSYRERNGMRGARGSRTPQSSPTESQQEGSPTPSSAKSAEPSSGASETSPSKPRARTLPKTPR